MSDPGQGDLDRPLNPVEIEQAIRRLANESGRAVRIVTGRLEAFREAERVYDANYASAYLEHKGPAHEKKYAAELATTHLRQDRDVAEVAWRYAERSAASLERQLSAYQSINRSVSQMFSAAGVMGEGG
jgi:hypothetical protein